MRRVLGVRSRTLVRMSCCPPDERLPAGRVASHLGVMAAVAAVMGVVVAGLAIPFAGVLGVGRASRLPRHGRDLPGELRTRAAGAADHDPRRRRQHDRHALRPEPHQRPAEPDLADDGQGDRRDRGLPLLPARRARPEGHAARAGHQPGQRRRRAGRLVDHPADGQDDAARPGQDQGRAQGGHRRHLRAQDHASCATRSPSSRTTPRTGSSSATSTSPTSATAPTASRRPPGTTSAPTPRTSTCAQARDAGRPGQEPRRLRPDRPTPTAASSAATSCSTGWPSST